jgi:hypothetical protein
MLKVKKRLRVFVLLRPCTFFLLSHFLSHEEQKIYIRFVYLAEKSTKLAKRPRTSTGNTRSRGRSPSVSRELADVLTVIEERVNGNFNLIARELGYATFPASKRGRLDWAESKTLRLYGARMSGV